MRKLHPMPDTNELADDLIGAQEAADLLGLSRSQLHRQVIVVLVPVAFKSPGQRGPRLFRRSDIERLAR